MIRLRKAAPRRRGPTKSRSDVARELVAAVDAFVLELGHGELERLAMSPHVSVLQLEFLINLTANVQRLRVMLGTWRKETRAG